MENSRSRKKIQSLFLGNGNRKLGARLPGKPSSFAAIHFLIAAERWTIYLIWVIDERRPRKNGQRKKNGKKLQEKNVRIIDSDGFATGFHPQQQQRPHRVTARKHVTMCRNIYVRSDLPGRCVSHLRCWEFRYGRRSTLYREFIAIFGGE